MKKVIVIGCPGAGKSYFSNRLKEITNLNLYHLDMLYHNSDGSHISKDEFDRILVGIFKEDSWIIDGNYQRTMELRLKECDTVFLLDYSLDECLSGALSRVGVKRDDLPWIEESLDRDFKQKILDFPKTKLPLIYDLLDKYKDGKSIIIFKTREEADTYLESLILEKDKVK